MQKNGAHRDREAQTDTLVEMLGNRALETPGKTAFTFDRNPPCSYGMLWREASRFAACLVGRGLKHRDRVIIAIPNSAEFFYAFYGVLRAGGIAVPVFPGSGYRRIVKLAGLCGASFIVVSRAFDQPRIDEGEAPAADTGISLLAVEEREQCSGEATFPGVRPEDIAFIQYTSGSTGDPKGVQLSHRNLLINMEQMIAGMGITANDSFVSWLPVYHDMGLILMTMVPFYLGAPLVLLPTGILNLRSWIAAIHEHKATFTAAPDFAYRLCLVYVTDPENYDLSGLRVALNAAEPVRSRTIEAFEKRFNLSGVMLPAYGLAEATVGVSGWRPGTPVKVDDRGFVSVGKPFPGVEVQILDDGRPTAVGETGEIAVKSAANTCGYYANPEATAALLTGDRYILTGDLGHVDDVGDLYIVGRKKNMIIQSGYSISSREVEELTDAFSFARRSAAVGMDRGGNEGEQVYIFIELKSWGDVEPLAKWEEMVIDVVDGFHRNFGFRPGRVYLVKPRTIPLTYNGKIQYSLLAEQYKSGQLQEKEMILFPLH